MKKLLVGLTCLFLLLSAGAALAADVALTSVGQSPDAVMVKVVMKKLKVEADYDALMKPEGLAGQKVLVAVIGGSSKGLGAAGINADQEKARAVSLLEAAKKKGMKILVMHVGGEGRRGTLTDLFINAAVPFGERLILVKGGNNDGLFTKLAKKGVPITEVASVAAVQAPLEQALKDWKILP
jgi:hypothetical protein